MSTKVLLASPYTPNELGWGEDMDDLFSCRLSRAQGAFTLHGYINYWALHLIAENIDAQTTVLEYAHLDEFEEELRRSAFDFVGIQVKSIHTRKVARMVESIRRISPSSKIVLGGYGILGLDNPMPNDPENLAGYIMSNVDYVCREEGVRFFRRLIGDEPVERPITQFHLPVGIMSLNGMEDLLQIEICTSLASLGCPNGCEFCNTSAFFNRRKIQVADPYELFTFMKHFSKLTLRKKGAMPFHLVFDEDFLLDRDYVRTLGRLLKEDDEACLARFFCFASLKAIEQYDGPDELADLGLGAAWIGVESFEDEVVTSDHKIEKRSCSNIEDVIGGLKAHGVSNVLSFILGWDFHNPRNVMPDVERFIRLQPTFYQIAPLSPCPGTELYRRMQKEGRIRPQYAYDDIHIWCDEGLDMKNFDYGQIKEFFDKAHEKLYEENGPSILSMAETNMNFYEKYIDSPRHYMARRAELAGESTAQMYPALAACVSLARGEGARARAVKMLERHRRLFGEPTFPMKVAAATFERVIGRHQKRWDAGTRTVVSDRPWIRTSFEPGRPPVRRVGPPREHEKAERERRRREEKEERRGWFGSRLINRLSGEADQPGL